MTKIDLKKDLKGLYSAKAGEPVLVEVPPLNFLLLDGHGDPNTAAEFQAGTEALYSLAYTLKFMLKKRGGFPEYAVMPLEGLWWAEDMAQFSTENKDAWDWTLMIAQPEFITHEFVQEATADVARKKGNSTVLEKIRFERFQEGTCGQILHLGPYSEERPTIECLHGFIQQQGLQLSGKHHEIYLSDPRRTAPEKLKTILRQPTRKG